MCKAFSCIITNENKVLWKAGVDSHTDLLELNGLEDDKEAEKAAFVRAEVTSDDGYLHPEGNWTAKFDDPDHLPRWAKLSLLDKADDARKEWQKQVYTFNFEEARNPVKPWRVEAKVGEEEMVLLREWASVWDSVRDSVWDSVRASVGAYLGSLFPQIEKWAYCENIGVQGYPFRSGAELWRRGLVPVRVRGEWRLYHPLENQKALLMWSGAA